MITARDFFNAILNRADRAFDFLKEKAYFDLKLMPPYQPHPLKGRGLRADRENESRWRAIDEALPKSTALSAMDIGCNIGFFSFRMGERGGACLGVDFGENEIRAARALAATHKIRNVGFICNEVTPDVAKGLPNTDVVICMSVFHHWVRKHGLEHAEEIMSALTAKCNHTLIFETGQFNETSTSWAESLSFMGESPEDWIQQFLTNLGFNKVTKIGSFGTSLSDVKRELFAAVKTGTG